MVTASRRAGLGAPPLPQRRRGGRPRSHDTAERRGGNGGSSPLVAACPMTYGRVDVPPARRVPSAARRRTAGRDPRGAPLAAACARTRCRYPGYAASPSPGAPAQARAATPEVRRLPPPALRRRFGSTPPAARRSAAPARRRTTSTPEALHLPRCPSRRRTAAPPSPRSPRAPGRRARPSPAPSCRRTAARTSALLPVVAVSGLTGPPLPAPTAASTEFPVTPSAATSWLPGELLDAGQRGRHQEPHQGRRDRRAGRPARQDRRRRRWPAAPPRRTSSTARRSSAPHSAGSPPASAAAGVSPTTASTSPTPSAPRSTRSPTARSRRPARPAGSGCGWCCATPTAPERATATSTACSCRSASR